MTRRVLYVNAPAYVGGAEISLLILMSHLDASCFQSALLTSQQGNLAQYARNLNIEVFINPLPGLRRRYPYPHLAGILRLALLLRQQQISIMHTNCESSLIAVHYASLLTHVPFVSHVRDFVRGWFWPQNLRALKAARSVIANSNAIADTCRSAGIPSQRLVTIYNPIDLEVFNNAVASDSAGFRQEIGCAAATPLIGIVGQVQEIKGHREFIEAALKIASDEPTVHFAIIGESNGTVDQMFSAEMQAIVSHSPYADRIHFTGFRTDVSAVIKALDILAVPSWMEPFGRSVVEGMAVGCAVIGTRAGGIPEIITDGVDGVLIPPRDAQALYAAMQRLLHDENLRRFLGGQGKQSASRFSINSHAQKMQALYHSVLQP